MMMMDDALAAAYVEVDEPADRLILHEALAARFIDVVQQFMSKPINREQALQRLITLRKMGRLPRLRRRRG